MLRRYAIPLSLIALVLIVFWPVAGFDFLSYDDGFNITNNWRVTRFSLANLLFFWKGPYENLYIPITYNLWSILARLSEFGSAAKGGVPDPLLFHAVNLLLHSTSALVVLVLLRSLGVGGWAGWGAALVFALHPVQVEAVAWVTGLKDLLSGLFTLVAIWQYTVYARAGQGRHGHRAGPYTLTSLSLALAMLAKPGAVVTPLLLLIIGRLLLERGWRQLFLEITPLLVLVLPVVMVTKFAQPDTRHAWQPDLWQRVLVSGDTLSFYLAKLVLPWSLGPDYGRTPELVLGRGPLLYLTACLPVAVLGASWRVGRKWLAAALLFACALLPVSGLILFDFQNISTVADRYLYVAMLGPALASGWGLARWRTRPARLVFLVLVTLLSAKAFVLVWTWKDSTVFNSHAVRINPRSWVAYNNLGIAEADQGRDREALAAFTASLAANPGYAEAENNLGALYHKLKRDREATTHLQKALDLDPGSFKAAFHLAEIANTRAAQGEAIAYYQKALAAKPDFIEAYNNLGLLLLEDKRPGEALALFRQAVDSCPEHPMLYYNLARSYAELGRREESIAALLKAATVDPTFAPAYRQLGIATGQIVVEHGMLRTGGNGLPKQGEGLSWPLVLQQE